MNSLEILNTSISINDDGLYSLSDLHRSTGQKRHAPKEWLRLKRTQNVIKELQEVAIARGGISPLSTGRGKETFVCRELVYSYAMTISAKFEIEVIQAFDKAAKAKLRAAKLQGKAEWQQNRELGKYTRNHLTDRIKSFIAYAVAQGSKSYAKYGYKNLTKMVNRALGIEARDLVSEDKLHLLASAELIQENALVRGMNDLLPYKVIYQQAKHEVEAFAAMVKEEVTHESRPVT